MSALIIASHVKEGLEMAREHGLPHRVLNFVPMHHGTTRIEYFYRRAVQQTSDDDPDVLESEFRYPGPRPDSCETGILMLADGVEAASRSLDDPTHKKLESLIDDIFSARAEDGQLNDTDLTFRDLNTIKDTFLSMLIGIYHVRVKYPEQDEDEADSGSSEGTDALKSQPDTTPDDTSPADDSSSEKTKEDADREDADADADGKAGGGDNGGTDDELPPGGGAQNDLTDDPKLWGPPEQSARRDRNRSSGGVPTPPPEDEEEERAENAPKNASENGASSDDRSADEASEEREEPRGES
jgi:hypothetical protein